MIIALSPEDKIEIHTHTGIFIVESNESIDTKMTAVQYLPHEDLSIEPPAFGHPGGPLNPDFIIARRKITNESLDAIIKSPTTRILKAVKDV